MLAETASRSYSPRDRLAETIRILTGHVSHDIFRRKEKLQETHFHAAHVFPLRIESWDQALTSFLPGRENTADGQFFVTTSSFLLKKPPSPAAGHLLFLGGRRIEQEETEEKDGGRKKIKKLEEANRAATRELWEEAHLGGILPDTLCPLVKRHHVKFDLPAKLITQNRSRIIYDTEEVFLTETPSFLVPHTFDPDDRAKEIVRLNAEQLEELIQNEVVDIPNGQGPKLLRLADTLTRQDSPARKKQNAVSDERETEELKQAMVYQANLYETQVQMEIAERLLSSPAMNLSADLIAVWSNLIRENLPLYFQEIERQTRTADDQIGSINPLLLFQAVGANYREARKKAASNALTALSLPQLKQLRRNFYDIFQQAENGMTAEEIDPQQARVKLIRAMRSALQTTSLEHNIRFIKNSGPQQSFIFMQNLLSHETLTTYDYQLLGEIPQVKNIFDLLCDAFEINPGEPDWYTNLEDKLRAYHDIKRRADRNAETKEERDYVARIKKMLYEGYARLYLIKNPDDINLMMQAAVEFYRQNDRDLALVFKERVRNRLVPDIPNNHYLDLDELIIRGFGIGYDRQDPDYIEKRWIDWKICLTANKLLIAQELHRNAHRPAEKDPFDMIFAPLQREILSLEEFGPETLTSSNKYTRFILNFGWDRTYDHRLYDTLTFSEIPIEILTRYRLKELYAILLKYISRGTAEEGANIDDYLGRMLVIDSEKFWLGISRKYPLLNKNSMLGQQIYRDFVRDVVSYIISQYLKLGSEYGFSFDFMKAREEGPGGKPGILAGVLPPHKKYPGGRGTRINWNWLKAVMAVAILGQKYEEELQVFPSLADALLKLEDQKFYNVRRHFEIQYEGYFPPALVFYRLRAGYKELIEGTYQEEARTVFQRRPAFA